MRYLLLLLYLICYIIEVYSSCENTVSVTDFNPKNCDRSQDLYYKEFIDDSCVPGCYYGLGLGEFCFDDDECAPGLKCNEWGECELDSTSCASFQHSPLRPKWIPECLPDGTFAPKQCKGEPQNGRCFCYSRFGERIFGEAWAYESQNMTCACSRHRSEMMIQGRTDVTLHCDSMGNYEQLQCESGSCWCADAQTGQVQESVVPESMMTLLPCFDRTEVGSKYLRQCESQENAQAIMRKEFFTHGTTHISLPYIICDWDGSFGKLRIDGGQVICTWRDGTNAGTWAGELDQLKTMTCNCARDNKIFQLSGKKITQDCTGNGNYKKLQQYDNVLSYCVDEDGYMTTDPQKDLEEEMCP